MSDSWEGWEGRSVDGRFVLGSHLGGFGESAFFRTRVSAGLSGEDEKTADAVIRLLVLGGAEAESQLRQWNAASELRHSNLIRILSTGRSVVEGSEVVYAVEEFAEENLAQIIPERALTADEVRGMLAPVLDALEFVHGKGLAHGRIRPSNILATGDQVKLSSDSVRAAGEVPRTASAYDAPEVAATGISAAGDVWSLGITLIEALTRRLPSWDAARVSAPEIAADVPEPFRGIAQRCLEIDPAKRCSIPEIKERLEARRAAVTPPPAPVRAGANATSPKKTVPWQRWAVPIAVLVGLLLFVLWRSSRTPGGAQQVPHSEAPATSAQPTQMPEAQPAPAQAEKQSAKDGIIERVTPRVSASAQRTITGKIKVRVRVKVDGTGSVTSATLTTAGPSKYFAREAVEAARKWKFAPAQTGGESHEWTLLFVFTRTRTEVLPTQTR
ncbi:MAG: TonB family protein [Terriglobales bacterium]